jgi:hypothetical protein
MHCDVSPNDSDVVDLRRYTPEFIYFISRFLLYLAFLEGIALTTTELWYIIKRCLGRIVTVRDLRVIIQRLRKLRTTSLGIIECPDCLALSGLRLNCVCKLLGTLT